MELVRYRILKNEEGYEIELRSRSFGPYATEREAVRAAVEVARNRAGDGRSAEVVVDENGTLRTEWPRGREREHVSFLAALFRLTATLH